MNRETLKFVEDAKDFFNESKKHFTYRDKDDEYIALRYGLNGDCIKVYQLGEELELFEQWCDKSDLINDDNKYKIVDNKHTPYQKNIIGADYDRQIIFQMNGIDEHIRRRDNSVIMIRIEGNDSCSHSAMSVLQARDVVEALSACIDHAEKVRKQYLEYDMEDEMCI